MLPNPPFNGISYLSRAYFIYDPAKKNDKKKSQQTRLTLLEKPGVLLKQEIKVRNENWKTKLHKTVTKTLYLTGLEVIVYVGTSYMQNKNKMSLK